MPLFPSTQHHEEDDHHCLRRTTASYLLLYFLLADTISSNAGGHLSHHIELVSHISDRHTADSGSYRRMMLRTFEYLVFCVSSVSRK